MRWGTYLRRPDLPAQRPGVICAVVIFFLGCVPAQARSAGFNFEQDITPLLTRFGCNSAACHAKAEGQNGFKLSVFGYDPAADYQALTKDSRGRRISPARPEQSLLLLKASGGMPHGGGVRIRFGTPEYERLRSWIAAGVPFGRPSDPTVQRITITPTEQILQFNTSQPLRVLATYSDGREVDVTRLAQFQSNNPSVAKVDEDGKVRVAEVPGQSTIMARYLGHVAVFRVLVPRPDRLEARPSLPQHNFIDALVDVQLQKLSIHPSGVAEDDEFLRRVYLDVIGTLPTPQEARRFFADRRPDRRTRLVDELLQRPEYADHWALKWADLLRVDRQVLSHREAYAYYRWIHRSVESNVPADQMVRALLTVEGPPLQDGPQGFYKVFKKPGETAAAVSQIFLGVRIACAECHHHPFDRWTQDDYYGMQAFFQNVTLKQTADGEAIFAQGNAEAKEPRSGRMIFAHPLGAPTSASTPSGDQRRALADWVTSPENPWFTRNLANRMVAHFMGRGLIEPVDDVRLTNPPSNPELLDALARHLVDSRFDMKQLIRTITSSRVYQTTSRPNATNQRDEQNYSRALFKRIPAEVLLDAISQATGVEEKFPGAPPGYRAIQLWDSDVPHYFLRIFGRPVRKTSCECERNGDASIAQVLHLMNSPQIQEKLSHHAGRVARLTRQQPDDPLLVDELYLCFFSRLPTAGERTAALTYLKEHSTDRRRAAEDVAWSLMNTLEFVFNH